MSIQKPNNMTAATLSVDGQQFTLPIHQATLGKKVIDIGSLKDAFTLDIGLMVTATCESKLTYIDGSQGILLHGGYPIEQLAEQSDFLEVAYLLLHQQLPLAKERHRFTEAIRDHTHIDADIAQFYQGFHRDAHPMAMLLASIGVLSASSHTNCAHEGERLAAAVDLIAKMPILAAMGYHHNVGDAFVAPRQELSYAENFLTMLFGTDHATDPLFAQALDRIFILHADHEQNASTSAVRLVGSTGANPYACISAGIAALWGPAHGAANEACLQMLHDIGDIKRIPTYIKRAKDKHDSFRLMGFGHRVYKNYDPRAKIMRQTCHEVLAKRDLHDTPLFKLAMELERIALEDDYFITRKLYPNIDFYSGLTLSALGIPMNMFTVIFALARTAGWIAQWHEMMSQTDHRMMRPRQLYTGLSKRDFVPLTQR